ncbi:MAG: hypothetical protein GY754_46335 [bacterium]|nr:hypothetical protein [bacterium]
MKKTGDMENLEALLDKYKFSNPLPEDEKEYSLVSKKRVYKRVLKSLGIYSFFSGIIVSIYFWLRKIGVGVSVFRGIMVFIIAGAVSLCVYLVLKDYPREKPAEPENRAELPLIVQPVDKARKAEPVKKISRADTHILDIVPFYSSSVNRELVNRATGVFINRLSSRKGAAYTVARGSKDRENARYRLTGSLEKAEDSIMVYIKLVDIKSSSIIFAGKKKTDSPENLDAACLELVDNAAKEMK